MYIYLFLVPFSLNQRLFLSLFLEKLSKKFNIPFNYQLLLNAYLDYVFQILVLQVVQILQRVQVNDLILIIDSLQHIKVQRRQSLRMQSFKRAFKCLKYKLQYLNLISHCYWVFELSELVLLYLRLLGHIVVSDEVHSQLFQQFLTYFVVVDLHIIDLQVPHSSKYLLFEFELLGGDFKVVAEISGNGHLVELVVFWQEAKTHQELKVRIVSVID